MSTPQDFPDWHQPVAVTEQWSIPNGFPHTFANGETVAGIDVSAVASVALNLHLPVGVFGDKCALLATWSNANVSTGEDTLTFHSATSYGSSATDLFWRLPVKGTQLALFYVTTGTGQLAVKMIGSSRSLNAPELTRDGNHQGRYMLDTNLGTLAAGASSGTLYVPPCAEKCLIRLSQKLALVQTVVDTSPDPAAPSTVTRAGVILGTDVTNQGVPFYLPGIGLQLRVDNLDTVGHATTLQVIDVS